MARNGLAISYHFCKRHTSKKKYKFMYVYINDEKFTEEPLTCGSCPFFSSGRNAMTPSASAKGHCRLFDEMHNSYITPPRRCHKLFKKAFTFREGEKLVITAN